ncbi:hypothetical protein GWI33_002361 [Rhynchophorus ferrugineus]|uniref:Uncharacterized protein n=1 Tax=Rhynchophorus ferrugineus TaxID=354439 RepID=A0A834MHL6_RHYFE|nr:hypothetical protein GWI33_002361 [Rhynchophorus ferrugineus]
MEFPEQNTQRGLIDQTQKTAVLILMSNSPPALQQLLIASDPDNLQDTLNLVIRHDNLINQMKILNMNNSKPVNKTLSYNNTVRSTQQRYPQNPHGLPQAGLLVFQELTNTEPEQQLEKYETQEEVNEENYIEEREDTDTEEKDFHKIPTNKSPG